MADKAEESKRIIGHLEKGDLAHLPEEFKDEILTRLGKKTEGLEEGAVTDTLTGLFNKKSFDEQIEAKIKRADKNKTAPFSLVFLDLNNFKAINDKLGHTKADKVLVEIGKVFKNSIRTTEDSAYRWAGDEFILLLNADKGEAFKRTREIEKEIVKAGKELSGVETIIDFGVAQWTKGLSPTGLFNEAEKKMYEMKRKRNNE